MVELAQYSGPVYNVRYTAENIVGVSAQMVHLFHTLNYLSSIRNSVIITGEEGTEKETAARAIHTNGDNPLNLEVKTYDASGISIGLVERNFGSEGGTLVLSDIAKLGENEQRRILPLVQRQGTGSLGSPLPVRLIGTSTSTLEELAADKNIGEFMRTVNPMPVAIPALREREGDIPLIADQILIELKGKKSEVIISERDVELLSAYTWPGNLTELSAMVRGAYARAANEERVVGQDTFDIHLERIFHESIQSTESVGRGAINIPFGEKWYSQGVVPVVVRTFSQIRGAYKEGRILQAIKDGRIYGEKVGKDIIAYLTPSNKEFAMNTRMVLSSEIDKDMHNSRFDPSRPFQIETMSDLARVTGRDTRKLHSELETHERRFDIPYSEKLFFTVADSDTERFIPENTEDRDKLLRRWRRTLVEKYNGFDSWEPGQVPPDFLDDVTLNTELLRANAHESGVNLFPNGATAVPVSVLRGFSSTINGISITDLIRNNEFYGGVVKGTSRGESPRVLVLEPHNVGSIFRDTTSTEYLRVASDIRSGEFSEFAQRGPWKLYDVADINRVLGLPFTDHRVRESLDANQQNVCVVSNHGKPSKFVYYALNLGTARYAIPRSMGGWVEKIKTLQEDIRGNFPRQKEWLEKTLGLAEREKEKKYLAGLGVDDSVLKTLAQLFPEGATPIAISVLGQFDGLAKSLVTLQKYANQGEFYGDCYRSRGDCEAIPSVVFLEPEHGEVVFSDIGSPEYTRVIGRIESDEKLREHTRVPWGVFDVASINRVLGFPGTSQEARKRLEDHKGEIYVVNNYRKSSRSTFYLLNMLTAHCAVPVNVEDREGKIGALQSQMMDNYRRQEARVQSRLEASIDRPVDTRLEVPKVKRGMLDTLAGMFPNGAAAVSTAVLSQFDTTISPPTIKGLIEEGRFYGEVYRSRGDSVEAPRVLFLEPNNIGDVFQEGESVERDALMRELAVGKLTDITSKGPWKLFDVSEIYQVGGIPTSDPCVRDALKDNEHVYVLSNHGKNVRAVYYLLTLNNIEHILPPGSANREERAGRLQTCILGNYERQKVWVDKGLEALAREEHKREDARIGVMGFESEVRDMLGNMFVQPVVPVATAVLGKMDSAKDYPTILGRTRAGVVYGEVLKAKGGADPVARVVFLGESDLEQMFKDTSSEECGVVREAMKDKKFGEHTQQPWKVYDNTELNKILGFSSTDRRSKDHLDEHVDEVYVVPSFGQEGRSTYYLLNLETACLAVPYGTKDRVAKVRALQQDILGNAGHQQEWVDKKLEEIAQQETEKVTAAEVSVKKKQKRETGVTRSEYQTGMIETPAAPIETPVIGEEVIAQIQNMFSEGAVPVRLSELAERSSMSRYSLTKAAKEGAFYGEGFVARVGVQGSPLVVFYEPKHRGFVFDDASSQECTELEARLNNPEFKEHTSLPWAVFDLATLNRVLDYSPLSHDVRDALREHSENIFTIYESTQKGTRSFYLLNLETAHLAIPSNAGDRGRLTGLIHAYIMDNLEGQRKWMGLESAVKVETVARPAPIVVPPEPIVVTPPLVVEVPVEPVVTAVPNIIVPGPQDYSFLAEIFPEGAIAFCLHPLASWDFTAKYKDMAKYARQGRYHAELLRGKQGRPRVGVFEPENIGLVFEKEAREHCQTYRGLARSGGNGLVELARASPWKVYDAEMISEVIGLDGEGSEGVTEELRRNGEQLFQVFSPVNPISQIEAEEVYVVTMDTANLAVPQYFDQADHKVELLRQDILGNVPRLQAWVER